MSVLLLAVSQAPRTVPGMCQKNVCRRKKSRERGRKRGRARGATWLDVRKPVSSRNINSYNCLQYNLTVSNKIVNVYIP